MNMEKIKLKFSVNPSLFSLNGMVVVLTLDEKGKSYTAKRENSLSKYYDTPTKNKEELPPLPKRVLNAFTESAINKILSKDEIPNESGMEVLDGCSYEITIIKDGMKKRYYANEASIDTYPLLRYLASWCRRH